MLLKKGNICEAGKQQKPDIIFVPLSHPCDYATSIKNSSLRQPTGNYEN